MEFLLNPKTIRPRLFFFLFELARPLKEKNRPEEHCFQGELYQFEICHKKWQFSIKLLKFHYFSSDVSVELNLCYVIDLRLLILMLFI